MTSQQAAADFAAFSAPDPVIQAAEKKEREDATKKTKKQQEVLQPEQLRMADKLAESMKADREATEKFELIQKLQDYVKLLREYHPERVEYIKAPKNFGVKNTCEELRIWIKDIQAELGKKGGLDIVKQAWSEGFKIFEKINEGGRFGLRVDGIGLVATQSVMSRHVVDPESGQTIIAPGPAVPTLAEFTVKHSNWFSSDVDVRMVFMAMELVAGVHRMNSQKDINVTRAAQTAPSQNSKDKMEAL